MSDKDFKVKNKLVINGLTQVGPLVADSNKQVDATPYLTPLQGGTGTTTAPSSGQILYSSSGTTYAPTALNTLDVKGASYSDNAPSSPVVGQIWVESDSSSDSFDPNIIRRKSFTATANQTVFTTDYVFIDGYEQVYFNGLLLLRNTDYTTNGASYTVTLATGAAAGDIIEVVSITNLNSINTATTTTNNFTGAQTITSTQNGNNFVINAPGGETPNFTIQGNGEQTFRFHNTNLTGTTRTSWKMASRVHSDWSWIWYTDSLGTGKNDLTLANRSHNPAFYFDENSNSKFAGSLATTNQYYAGKNILINGAMEINQRGLGSVSSGWICDRWYTIQFSGTGTWQQVNISPGSFSEQVSTKAIRITSTSSANDFAIGTPIEDVTTFAGRTVNVSFWIRSSMSNIGVDLIYLGQNFGSGGSPTVITFAETSGMSYGTSWTKVNTTVTLPSVSGKTIGTGNLIELRIDPATTITSGSWVEITHVQIELGQYPSVFSRHRETIAEELNACQRYFIRYEKTGGNQTYFASGQSMSTTRAMMSLPLPVNMRIASPSVSKSAGAALYNSGSNYNLSSISVYQSAQNILNLDANVSSGLTSNAPTMLSLTTNGDYLDFSAEL